jgi:hypothetical protein
MYRSRRLRALCSATIAACMQLQEKCLLHDTADSVCHLSAFVFRSAAICMVCHRCAMQCDHRITQQLLLDTDHALAAVRAPPMIVLCHLDSRAPPAVPRLAQCHSVRLQSGSWRPSTCKKAILNSRAGCAAPALAGVSGCCRAATLV